MMVIHEGDPIAEYVFMPWRCCKWHDDYLSEEE